jgi:hypothetical protein
VGQGRACALRMAGSGCPGAPGLAGLHQEHQANTDAPRTRQEAPGWPTAWAQHLPPCRACWVVWWWCRQVAPDVPDLGGGPGRPGPRGSGPPGPRVLPGRSTESTGPTGESRPAPGGQPPLTDFLGEIQGGSLRARSPGTPRFPGTTRTAGRARLRGPPGPPARTPQDAPGSTKPPRVTLPPCQAEDGPHGGTCKERPGLR